MIGSKSDANSLRVAFRRPLKQGGKGFKRALKAAWNSGRVDVEDLVQAVQLPPQP